MLNWLKSGRSSGQKDVDDVNPDSGQSETKEPGIHPFRWRIRVPAWVVILMHLLGAVTSVQAVMSTRTSQGAIAWAISLNTFPYLAVPAYWGLGQSKFDGYELLRRSEEKEKSETEKTAERILREQDLLREPQTPLEESHARLLNQLSCLPITTGNSAQLLIDGDATFDAILEGMKRAREYILFQFYILRDDKLGQKCKQIFIDKAG